MAEQNRTPQPIVNQSLILCNGYYVFVDVLGFKKMVIQSYETNTQEELLGRFHAAFTEAYSYSDLEDESGNWKTRVFSDNIILAYPTPTITRYQNLEPQFGDVVFALALYQLKMVLNGFFIRGGWTWNSFYIDERVLFGNAVIEAYDLESQSAVQPRIVLSETVKELVKFHLRSYGDHVGSPQNAVLLRGENETVFLNYLYLVIEDDDGFVNWDWVRQHRDAVQGKMEFHIKEADKKVYKKYLWVGQYHNYFCKTFLSGREGYSDQFLVKNVVGKAEL